MNSDVIQVLLAALASDPSNQAVRLHLADLLFRDGDFATALDHVRQVLLAEPTNKEALRLAIAASVAIGDTAIADEWSRLLSALSPSSGDPSTDHTDEKIEVEQVVEEPQTVTEGTSAEPIGPTEFSVSEADVDAFLRDVFKDDTQPLKLADVAGLKAVKKQIEMSFLAPMRNEELRSAYGKSLRGGLLLYGPPGCGKTFLARAIAGELGAQFFAIGLHDVLDMWLGKSEQNLHRIFQTVRSHAPSVLFIDEVDALGFKRANLKHSVQRNVVVQLLTELDSIGSNNDGVFVLGATNQPWDIDSALRRPGRFDRTLLVLPPDEEAREEIVRRNLAERPVKDVNFRKIAKMTDGYSGADLRLVCETAVETAMHEAMQLGTVSPITSQHMEEACRRTSASTRSWFETAGNYAFYANQTGEYDELLAYMRKRNLR